MLDDQHTCNQVLRNGNVMSRLGYNIRTNAYMYMYVIRIYHKQNHNYWRETLHAAVMYVLVQHVYIQI